MTRPASFTELPTLADTLAQAFHNYSWTRWTVPAEDHAGRLRTLQQIYLEHVAHPYGMVWTVQNLSAAAAFIPAAMPGPPQAILDQISALHGEQLQELDDTEELLRSYRPDHDWVLASVGVAPQDHGQGLGTSVVAAGLKGIDKQYASCLVETSDPINLPFYRKLGFETVAEVVTGGPTVWIMLRPASLRG